MVDVLVVGGGVAGLSAALMLGRSHRDVVVVDAGHPRNAPAHQMHNVLSRDGTSPEEFRQVALRELDAYPGVSVRLGAVTALRAAGGAFEADLASRDTLAGRRLLLATGLADDLPPVPGMTELWGTSVFGCPYCHGWETTGKAIAVQGAALPRVRLALQLTRFSQDVVLCADGVPLDATAAGVLAGAGVAIRPEPLAALTIRAGHLDAVTFTEGPPLHRDALFVPNSTRQRSTLATDLRCVLLADGGVEVDELGRTSVPGVYAGDMAHRPTLPIPLASLTAAAAAGQVAAGALDHDLLCEDFGLPDRLVPQAVR